MEQPRRIKQLRLALEWTQRDMAQFLGLSQPGVTNLEGEQAESGPVTRLLDLLDVMLSRGDVRAGMTPERCFAAICAAAGDAGRDARATDGGRATEDARATETDHSHPVDGDAA